jgi:hypothetical protein
LDTCALGHSAEDDYAIVNKKTGPHTDLRDSHTGVGGNWESYSTYVKRLAEAEGITAEDAAAVQRME